MRQDKCSAQYIGHKNMQDTYHTENSHQKNGRLSRFKKRMSRGIFPTFLLCTITLVPSGLGAPSRTTTGSTATPLHWERSTPTDMERCINLSRWSLVYLNFQTPTSGFPYFQNHCLIIPNTTIPSPRTVSSTTKTKQSLLTGNTETNLLGGTRTQPTTKTG